MRLKTIVITWLILISTSEYARTQDPANIPSAANDSSCSVSPALERIIYQMTSGSGFYPESSFLATGALRDPGLLSGLTADQNTGYYLLNDVSLSDTSRYKLLFPSFKVSSYGMIDALKVRRPNLNIVPFSASFVKYNDLIIRSPWQLNTRYMSDTFLTTLLRELYLSANHRY